MKTSIAIIAACAGTLVFTQANLAQASYATAPEAMSPVRITDVRSAPAIRLAGNINTSRSNIKHGLAVPREPNQAGSAINTSRSNIKHQGLAAPGNPKPAGQAINTTRSNIKHGAQ